MDDSSLKFQKIYAEYYGKIHLYLKRMAGDAEADDLTQEVFVKLGQALDKFRGESQLSTWIYQIATNTALDRFRASSRSGYDKNLCVEEFAETEEEKNVWTGEKEASTEQKVIRQEMNGCIREIINTLPEADRTVIVLSELEGLKDNEIAQILGLSLQATKIRIHRARGRLKSELSKACVFYRDDRNELACDRKSNLVTLK